MRVLVVEDEPLLLRAFVNVLQMHKHAVLPMSTVRAAIATIGRESAALDAAIVDLGLPDGPGEQVLEALQTPDRPGIAVVTGRICAERWAPILDLCDAVMPKPLSPAALLATLSHVESVCPRTAMRGFVAKHKLSSREAQVVLLAARGLATHEALAELKIARGTLSALWQRIFVKTSCHSQRDVLARFINR